MRLLSTACEAYAVWTRIEDARQIIKREAKDLAYLLENLGTDSRAANSIRDRILEGTGVLREVVEDARIFLDDELDFDNASL